MRQRKQFKLRMTRLANLRRTTSSIFVTGASKDEGREDDGNTEEGATDEETDDGVEAGKLFAYMFLFLG